MRNEATAILPEAEVLPIRPSRQFLLQQSILNMVANVYGDSIRLWNGSVPAFLRWYLEDSNYQPYFIINETRREFRTLCARYNIEVTT